MRRGDGDNVDAAEDEAVLPVQDPIVRGLLHVALRRCGGELLLTFTEENLLSEGAAGLVGQVVHVRDYHSGRWRFELGDPAARPVCAGCGRGGDLAPRLVRTPGLVGLPLRAAHRDPPDLLVLCPACARRRRAPAVLRWWRRVRRLTREVGAAARRFWSEDA